ncbi:MAG: DUF4468 domain-containing protein [Prevotella sp.]|nr:DUF4468 domain-containing protein [Prevotella sp.]
MRQLIIALLIALPVAVAAQENEWEKQEQKAQTTNPDAKYLAGAVPEVDGHVMFSTTVQVPGKTAEQIYERALQLMTELTKTSNQLEQSRIAYTNAETHQIVGSYQEWLVFKNKPLNLDRTRMLYQLVADCRDGEMDLKMMRIVYLYDEERNPTTYKAEEWINDKYGLNKKQTKLARVSGKFRRKTIDRKDYLFKNLGEMVKK